MSSKAVFAITNVLIFAVLLGGAAYIQVAYDNHKPQNVTAEASTLSLWMAKGFDVELHSALASYLWLNTRTELPFFQEGYQKFAADLNLINSLDPRFSTPYAYSVLVLPYSRYGGRLEAAVNIGERGLENADPDWQIPFYLGALYQLQFNDRASATKYFDIAAQTPGIPDIIRRYAVNYGIFPETRGEELAIWTVIYESAGDPLTRQRAKEHIEHIQIIDFLQNAVAAYKEKTGHYPAQINDLITAKILTGIPPDPFGFQFDLYEGGSVVGIKQASTTSE